HVLSLTHPRSIKEATNDRYGTLARSGRCLALGELWKRRFLVARQALGKAYRRLERSWVGENRLGAGLPHLSPGIDAALRLDADLRYESAGSVRGDFHRCLPAR